MSSFDFLKRFFDGVASFLYRRPAGGTRAQAGQIFERLTQSGFLILLTSTLVLFTWILSEEVSRWKRAGVSVALEPGQWKVYLAHGDASRLLVTDTKLWGSAHARKAKSELRMSVPEGKTLWLSYSLSEAKRIEILEKKARNLTLGWIKGSYRLWLNGEFLLSGSRKDREPLVHPVAWSALSRKGPLFIALEIVPEAGAAIPDVFAAPFQEGFATESQAGAYRSLMDFWKKSRPWTLFIVNLLFAVVFYLLWTSERKKQEYAFLAFYGLVSAMFQLRMMDLFLAQFSASLNYSLDLMLRFSEGSLGLFLGLSFSRLRREVFWALVPLSILAPVLLVAALPSGQSLYAANTVIDEIYVPLCYLLGAFSCALQGFYLKRMRALGVWIPSRSERLFFFALGLSAIAVLSLLQTQGALPFVYRALFSRFAHLSLVLLLGSVAIREYRTQKKLLERAPVSRYHSGPTLPLSLSGGVLLVDLKNSEPLFRTQDSGKLVELVLSHLWSAVVENQGVVLQTEGDGLRAFFDRAVHEDPGAAALLALVQMEEKLSALSSQLRLQGLLSEEYGDLRFRASLAMGAIKPVWQEMGSDRLAAWVEVGGSNPLVESARLLELERKIPGSAHGSRGVVLEETALQVEAGLSPKIQWVLRGETCRGKHDRAYQVAVFSMKPSAGTLAHAEKLEAA